MSVATLQTTIAQRFAAVRSWLVTHQLDAYLVPSADEHLNEYLPEAKQRRDWLSGFTGSAGELLLGRELAWLFVDSRYYEQAEQVDAGLMQVVKLGLEGHKTLEETLQALGTAQPPGTTFRLGYDPFTLSIAQFHEFQKQLPGTIQLVAIGENLVDQGRSRLESTPPPVYANSPLFSLPETLTGEGIAQKLDRVRQKLQPQAIQILPVTKLDQIAWLFNLRGWDVPYNPVFIAYAIVTLDHAYLFTNLERVSPEVARSLPSGVTLLPYADYAATLRSLVSDGLPCRVLLDPKRTTMGTRERLTQVEGCTIVESDTPIEGLKARKNAIELEQMQAANLKASRAKTRTLCWLADQTASGNPVTELDVAATVERFYAEEAEFQGLSFNTIAATGANSSIVHYGTPSAERSLQAGEFLLLDSGAQFASGTTDDTRTVIVGEPTTEQITHYTEVLKAHINCVMQRFPKGATGAQLDGITRSALWQAGLDYGHGTGHGVGVFLNVHEGPIGISKRISEPLEPGMVTSVEPGYYQPGKGGIRLENLYIVRELSPGEGDKTPWYGFESLTYIPFDSRLIDRDRLTAAQRDWLTQYHQTVLEKLSPLLDVAAISWLQIACRP